MQRSDAAQWRDSVDASVQAGYRDFVTLMGIDDGGVQVWLRLRNAHGDDRVLAVDATHGVPSVIDVFAEAAWYEREASEMYGIAFIGHDTKPLLLPEGSDPAMLRDAWLPARQSTPWPGEQEPGGAATRRRQLPPGVRA